MTLRKPFELPMFYRLLTQEAERRLLYPILRLLWFFAILGWLYVESHRWVSIFDAQMLFMAWLGMLGWALISAIVSGLFLLQKSTQLSENLLLLHIALDGCVLGMVIAATGGGYSLGLLPMLMYVICIIFLGRPLWVWIAAIGLAGGCGLGWQFIHGVLEPMGNRDVLRAVGGAVVIAAVSAFLSMSLRRHATQVVREQVYQKWLEQLNTVIFDLMPAGALVCDEWGRIRRANPVIESYVKSVMDRDGSILELDPEWSRAKHLPELMGEDCVIRLVGADHPEGKRFRVVFRPLALHTDPGDSLHLLLLYDVTELERKQEEAELGRRWKSFQSISAGLVHEIRNPLGAILGVVESILNPENLDDVEREKMLSMVRYEGQRMNTLVQDFLDSLQSNLVLNKEPCDIVKLCEDFYQLVSKDQRIKSKQVQLAFHHRLKGSPRIEIDKDRMLQVLHNLFGNALQAVISPGGNPASGIRLEIEESGQRWVVIRFVDHGLGISPEVMPHIFDPFFTTKQQGTGLGLSISYRIIDAHGGKLRVISQPDRPTRAEIWLPR